MTQEEKQLLLQDLCARLPYHPKCEMIDELRVVNNEKDSSYISTLFPTHIELFSYHNNFAIKPYLRSMSNMTKEEKVQLSQYACIGEDLNGEFIDEVQRKDCAAYIDWLNKNHFDYRGLIEKGLALEAPEGMYNLKNK